MEIITYNLDSCIYYPLYLNNNPLKNNKSKGLAPDTLDESILDHILGEILQDSSQKYIIDFGNINSINLSIKHYEKIINENVAILTESEKLFNSIKEKHENKSHYFFYKEYHESDWKQYLIYFCDNLDNDIIKKLTKYVNNIGLSGKIDYSISKKIVAEIIFDKIRENSTKFDDESLKYIESSNIFVNYYINIKHLFYDTKILKLIIYKLRQNILKIISSQKKENDICLLGVSNNGIILSKLLGYSMDLPTRSIYHIGPRYCLNNDIRAIKELSNKKYILISDVICLGGEYRMTKGIIHMLNADLIGSIGVVKIKDVYRGEVKDDIIVSLIDDINEYGFDYKITIDKGVTNNGFK